MNCLAIETPLPTTNSFYSGPDVLSSFLEEFRDKNSHLFPSSDFTSMSVLDDIPCGKRSREVFESLNDWSDDICSIFATPAPASATVKIEPCLKKQKCYEVTEQVEDACSLSPSSLLDQTSCPSVSPASTSVPVPVVAPQENAILQQALSTVSSLSGPVREAMFASLSRFAERADNGKMPLQIPNISDLSHRIEASHDYFTMQALQPISIQPLAAVTPRNPVYYSVPSNNISIPYTTNMPYLVPVNSPPMPANYSPLYSINCPPSFRPMNIPTPLFSEVHPSVHA